MKAVPPKDSAIGSPLERSSGEQTRARLLEVAAAILAERGYGQTRLGDVARRAELQPPAVYYHFANRDDLVAEVMRTGQRRVREHVERAIALTPGSCLDRVEAAVEAHLRIQLELSDFAAAVTRNAGHVPDGVRRALQAESDAYHDLWRQLLAAARRDGELCPDLDPTVARMLVIGALNWSVEWSTPRRPIESLVDSARSFVHHALTRPAASPAP